ncbi:hypothetical protein [Actinoalloteichus sp. GBA129-24]|uniref:hypothetical protein n=1 Tax=Actinoalloteichus sp. GBA129-24 TaxID=1612551 RepID=UPI0009506E86|nr:hypothetical protein [Actinoalloteichus sp. GBA129-24]APU22103.1 hypothetical protein UA75_20570 [Actinoalloteichus sp. GBA129-24]
MTDQSVMKNETTSVGNRHRQPPKNQTSHRLIPAIITVVVLSTSACTSEVGTGPVDTYQAIPGPCFESIETSLAEVVGDLFEQIRFDNQAGPNIAPGGGITTTCSVDFSQETSGSPGNPANRSITVRYDLRSDPNSPATSVRNAQTAYEQAANLATGPTEQLSAPIGVEGIAWYNDAQMRGGHVLFIDRNLLVTVSLDGRNNSTNETKQQISREDAIDEAIRIAEAIAEDL